MYLMQLPSSPRRLTDPYQRLGVTVDSVSVWGLPDNLGELHVYMFVSVSPILYNEFMDEPTRTDWG